MTDYVAWEVFVWVVGIIITLFTFVIGYLSKRIGEISIACDDYKKDAEYRLDEMEKCHLDNQVNLAKINKDIEYIKLQQQSIVVKIDELLKKAWCKQDEK